MLVDEPLMKVREVAAFLNVDIKTVRNLLRTGKIPHVQISEARIGIKPSDLRKFIAKNTFGSI